MSLVTEGHGSLAQAQDDYSLGQKGSFGCIQLFQQCLPRNPHTTHLRAGLPLSYLRACIKNYSEENKLNSKKVAIQTYAG